MKARVRRLWYICRELYTAYRGRLFFLSGIGLASGFLEGIGVSLLVPLFTLFVKGGDISSNVVLSFLSSALSLVGLSLSFRTLLIVTFSAFLLKTIALFVSGYLRARVMSSYRTSTRRRLYELFLRTNFSYLRRQKIGYLSHVILADVKQATRFFDDMVGFLLAFGSSLAFLGVAFALSWQITLLTAALGAVLSLTLLPLLRRIRAHAYDLNKASRFIPHSFAETLAGIKTVKALAVERVVAEQAHMLFQRMERAEFRKHAIKLVTKLSFEPVSVIFVLAVFAVSYYHLSFDLVSFVAIIYLINRIFGNLSNVLSSSSNMLELLPSVEELAQALSDARAHADIPRGASPFSFAGKLKVEHISFAYGQGAPTLTRANFSVQKGEQFGIIGPSGAGKTTLVDLLLGLMPPSSGRITLDGVDMREVNWEEWRRKVIYVAQEPFLLNASVRDNVRFYDSSISNEEVAEACHRANLDVFLASLPQGLDTPVGERGNRLSGGERQRVALARALARHPAILILDEATSALDVESERSIQEALARVRGEVTIILIAHRLSTVLGADRIIALDEGRIVEEGTPAALQANKESYLSRMLALGRETPSVEGLQTLGVRASHL